MNKQDKNVTIPEYDYMKPASAQDCTGLIPAGIVDDNEIENYEALYPFLPSILINEEE